MGDRRAVWLSVFAGMLIGFVGALIYLSLR